MVKSWFHLDNVWFSGNSYTIRPKPAFIYGFGPASGIFPSRKARSFSVSHASFVHFAFRTLSSEAACQAISVGWSDATCQRRLQRVRPSCRERMRPSGSSGDDNSGSRTQPPAELGPASHFMLCQWYGAAAVKWRSNPLQRRNGPTILQKLCLKKNKKKNTTTHRVWAQGEALPTDGK